MVGRQSHINLKWHCWRRPQGHYFFITKTLSKRLCTCYCWRNIVFQRSLWSSWTGDRTQRDFDSSRKKWTFGSGPLLYQRLWRTREEMACKRKRIELSLVFVTIMLHMLTYVVSNKLFWNWNGVVRFESQEFWFDKGFVIWIFHNYCLVQIVSLWSLSIGVQIVFTTTKLVDRIRNLTWNAFPNDEEEDFLLKECAAYQIFYEIKCAAGKTYQTRCAAGRIFWLSPDGYSVLLM